MKPWLEPRQQKRFASVGRVTSYSQPETTEVHPNLLGPMSQRLALKQSPILEPLEDLKRTSGSLARPGIDSHKLGFHWVGRYFGFCRESIISRRTLDQRNERQTWLLTSEPVHQIGKDGLVLSQQ
jgi:hypothetical protein